MSLLANWLESLSYEVEISEECTKKISPMSSCSACVDECPANALFFEGGKISLLNEVCLACGLCVTVCPVQAIKGQSPERKVENEYLLLDDDSPLPSFPELLYYHKKGIRFIHKHSVSEDVKKRIARANGVFEAMNAEPILLSDTVEQRAEEQPILSRRGFFAKLASDSKKTILSSMTPIKWRFNESSFRVSSLYKDWSLYEVRMDNEKCTLCEACFSICHSGVFSLETGILRINDNNCSGCRLCSDICRVDAIQITDHIHRSQELTVPLGKKNCEKCGRIFHYWEETNQCHICSSIQKPDFFL